MLFVHGSGGHHAAWWQQTPYFTTHGYSVVTLDLRGFGRSTSELDEYDSLEFPGDILAVLDDADIDRAVLVGQSIGASRGAEGRGRASGPCRRRRARALARRARPPGVRRAGSSADRAEAEKLPVLDRLMSKSFQESSPELTFLFRQMGTFNKAKMQDLRNLTAGGPTLETLSSLGVPICFLAGENDAVIRPATIRRAQELVPGSVLELIPDAPHSMYWERPDLFNAGIERFLKTVYA